MKKILFGFLLSATANLFAQESSVIAPIVIESNKKFFSDDHSSVTISVDETSSEEHENIGYALSRKTAMVIRNYGSYGALSSASIRGAGSNHTQVSWNGIPLNSPTTGQADLSLIPAGLIQTIEVVNGASGCLFGSGTFGGTVNLNNKADWNNRFTGQYSFNYGSFGHYGHLLKIRAGSRKFQYHLSAVKSSADNDFYYRDIYQNGSPLRKNSNSEYSDAGIMQNVYLDAGRGNNFEAGMWYQKKVLHIPAIMGSYAQSNARQKDSLFRAYLGYRKKSLNSTLSVRTSYLSDFLNYTSGDPGSSLTWIDSRINAWRLLNEIDYRFYLSTRLIAGGGVSQALIKGRSENYGGAIRENELALYGNLKYIYKDLILNAGIRKEFYDGLNPLPQYSAGIRYMLPIGFIIRASVSTKFRKPTLNEKYWRPGGNPNLNPEKGFGGELTTELPLIENRVKDRNLTLRFTGFFQSVDNWIQWIMKDSLTPVEYKKVHARGIEADLDYSFRLNRMALSGFFNYALNRSTIVSTYDNNIYYKGNQLIYMPVHSCRTALEMKYDNVFFTVSAQYTGKRETVETGDESLQLPPFVLLDASLAYNPVIQSVPLSISVRVDNLLDKQYEIIRSYPVPGRSVHLSVSLGFSKINKN